MSTKYQRPSNTYAGDAALANRSKYQSDAGQEPRVPISSAKIDGDFNYLIDALNSIDAASGSRSSIDDRLSVSMNGDGTLKGSVVASVDEWVVFQAVNMSRVNDTTITFEGDQTGLFTAGRRVRLSVSGATLYASVYTAAFGTSLTTLVLHEITDASGAADTIDAAPTALSYSFTRAGYQGNVPNLYTRLKIKASDPLFRINDTSGSGKEFALRNTGGAIEIVENTGTETAPVWVVRLTVDSTGPNLVTASLGLDLIANGTADRLMGFDVAGAATEVGTDGTLLLDNGVLSVVTGTSAGNIIALDGSAKLPAVDGSQLTNLPDSARLLQVVAGTSTSTYTSASSTFSDIVTASITTVTGSRVKVTVSYPMRVGGGSALMVGSARLLRDVTTLFTLDRACGMSVDQEGCMVSYTYVDTPPSAGTYVYKAQGARYSGSYNLISENLQTITLEEIAA